MKPHWRNFLLSLPERGLRSVTAVTAGLVREAGEVTVPKTVRQSRLYQNLVESTLRFLIEQVGQVEGVYAGEEKLSEDFLVRRAAGNGVELIGILAFRASPVWVLAALADVTGTGRFLIREIAASLQEEGLLDRNAEFSSVEEMLDGLESSAGRLATTVNTPPLDVATLRAEWSALRSDFARIPPRQVPGSKAIGDLWKAIRKEAERQHRSPFQISSLMAMSAISRVPQKVRWLSNSARLAARTTGTAVAGVLLEDYRCTLTRIRQRGYVRYAADQFRPYLIAACSQFSPQRQSLTEKFLCFLGNRRAAKTAPSRRPTPKRRKRVARRRKIRSAA